MLDNTITINETSMDSKEFMVRQQFWVGESSKKIQDHSKGIAKGGGKARKRRLLRSVVQSMQFFI